VPPCLPNMPALVISEEVAALPDPHAPPTKTEAPAFIDPDKPEEGWMVRQALACSNICKHCTLALSYR
jgi:hypothetical protein